MSVVTVDINEFMAELERKNLVIAPRNLVENAEKQFQKKQLRKQLLKKTALSVREIWNAEFFGSTDDLKEPAVRAYVNKYAKKNELMPVKGDQKMKYKLITSAVVRMAKNRGYAPEIAHLSEL